MKRFYFFIAVLVFAFFGCKHFNQGGKKFTLPFTGSGDAGTSLTFKDESNFIEIDWAFGAGAMHLKKTGTYKLEGNKITLSYKKSIKREKTYKGKELPVEEKAMDKNEIIYITRLPYEKAPQYIPYYHFNLKNHLSVLSKTQKDFFLKSLRAVYEKSHEGYMLKKGVSKKHKKGVMNILQISGFDILVLSNGLWPEIKKQSNAAFNYKK